LTKLDVDMSLGKEVTLQQVKKMKPDAVVLATGATAVIPDVPRTAGANVIEAREILEEKALAGKRAAIIGGELVGCETAEFLAEKGKKVTVTTLLPELAVAMHPALRLQFLNRLDAIGVISFTSVKSYEKITEAGLTLITSQGERKIIPADTVVLAAGYRPDVALFEKLKSAVNEVHLVGDCVEPRKIMDAIADGSRVGRQI
jgi:pyruvate/2-oxoglutarate dehydrogenase complex dihydrolipoamide dehydrogenase (E3) component